MSRLCADYPPLVERDPQMAAFIACERVLPTLSGSLAVHKLCPLQTGKRTSRLELTGSPAALASPATEGSGVA